jgi:hypothetical protein
LECNVTGLFVDGDGREGRSLVFTDFLCLTGTGGASLETSLLRLVPTFLGTESGCDGCDDN